jgi:hypothetical protein
MIKKPGQRPTRSQKLLLAQLVEQKTNEEIVVHHISEDTWFRLQLEIERRYYLDSNMISVEFERVFL